MLGETLPVIGKDPVGGHLLTVAGSRAPVVGRAGDPGVDLAPADDPDLVLGAAEFIEQCADSDHDRLQCLNKIITFNEKRIRTPN